MLKETQNKAQKHWTSPTELQTNAKPFNCKCKQYLAIIDIIFHSIIKKETGGPLKLIYKAIHL